MYEAIERRIDILASRTHYPCRYVIPMGAILINADHDAGSYACLRRLSLIDSVTCESVDFLKKLLSSE